MTGTRTPRRTAAAALGLTAAALIAAWALHSQFGETSLASLGAALRAQPRSQLVVAFALTALSFFCLALYDVIGARIVAAGRVPYRSALFAGATANAVSNTLGFHAVTGTVVRARIYRQHGLTYGQVMRIAAATWTALGLGFIAMFGAAELLRAMAGAQGGVALMAGVSIGVGLLLFVIWLATGRRTISLFGFIQPLPGARLALLMMGIGAVESAAAIGALYVLLPADLAPNFSVFAVGCIVAVALGIVSHAPGGVGVFEASITAMLAGAGRTDLLAALLMYRAIFNLLPFLLAVAALVLASLMRHRPINSTVDIGGSAPVAGNGGA